VKARSIVFFAALGLVLTFLIARNTVPAENQSTPVPFDKNSMESKLSYIDVLRVTKLAESHRRNSARSAFARNVTIRHYYIATDINGSQYIVRMSEERAAELPGRYTSLPIPVTIYGGREVISDSLVKLYSTNSISGSVGEYRNVATNRPRFESKDAFHETFGTQFFVEGRTGNPTRGTLTLMLIISSIVLLFATPKYISGKRLERQNRGLL
jgi:hypothetical protein